MKKSILFFAVLITVLSCKKEEVCTAADFTGTWKISGSACILSDATTLRITDLGGNKIQATYEGPGITSDFEPWTLNGCGFSGKVTDTDFGLDVTITGTLTDKTLKIENKGKALFLPLNCTENLTK